MKHKTKLSILVLGLASGISQAVVLAPSSVTGTGSFNNSTDLLTDGFFPLEFSTWNNATNVHWNGTTPQFTFDYGEIFQIHDVTLSVDNNDSYFVETSLNGSDWFPLFTIANSYGEVSSGMDTMSTDETNAEYISQIDFDSTAAQYLRIAAVGGDTLYSIGEFEVNGAELTIPDGAIPEPSGVVSLGALIGFGLLLRNRR